MKRDKCRLFRLFRVKFCTLKNFIISYLTLKITVKVDLSAPGNLYDLALYLHCDRLKKYLFQFEINKIFIAVLDLLAKINICNCKKKLFFSLNVITIYSYSNV